MSLRRCENVRRRKSRKNLRSWILSAASLLRQILTMAESTFGRGQNTFGPSLRRMRILACDCIHTDNAEYPDVPCSDAIFSPSSHWIVQTIRSHGRSDAIKFAITGVATLYGRFETSFSWPLGSDATCARMRSQISGASVFLFFRMSWLMSVTLSHPLTASAARSAIFGSTSTEMTFPASSARNAVIPPVPEPTSSATSFGPRFA